MLSSKREATDKEMLSTPDLLAIVTQMLDGDKAEDILTIDLKGKTEFADFMVVATGRSQRHISSIADKLHLKLKEMKILSHQEGDSFSEWFLVDIGSIIVHLFTKETRAYYDLEKMWQGPFGRNQTPS